MLLISCGGPAVETRTVDGLTFALERPAQVKLLEDYEYVVTLTDADGKPVEGAQVFLEQDMPAMPMNSPRPLGEPLGGGRYRLTGVFTMEGDWMLRVHAAIAGKEYVATFEQKVIPAA